MNDHPTTNSREQKRGYRFWLLPGLLGVVLTVAALLLAGAVYQALTTRADARHYPAPGEMVDVGGYKLHVYCTGSGSPTVILDALFPGTVSNWAWVQPEIAQTTRVCAYDRAGLGWSDSGPEPYDARKQAQELHVLLTKAHISGPFILVGHSLGGLTVRMFADQYPDEVAGMVLIEGTNPDTWNRLGLPEGVGADRNQLAIAPFLAKIGLFRLGLFPLPYAADPDLPRQQQLELQAFFDSAKSLETVRAVDNSFSSSLDQVRQAADLGPKPLAIVLGSKGDGSQALLQDLFAQQQAMSPDSFTSVIEGATHAGLVDNQQHAHQTSAVIQQVIEAVRTGQPLPLTPP